MAVEINKLEFAPKKTTHNILVIYTKKEASNFSRTTKSPSNDPYASYASAILLLDPESRNLVDLSGLDDPRAVVNIYIMNDPQNNPFDVSEKILHTSASMINSESDRDSNNSFGKSLCENLSNTLINTPTSSKKVNIVDCANMPTLFNASGSKSLQLDVTSVSEEDSIVDHEKNINLCKEQAESTNVEALVRNLWSNIKSKENGIIVNSTKLYSFHSDRKNKSNKAKVKSANLPVIVLNNTMQDVDVRSNNGNSFKLSIYKDKCSFSFDQKSISSDMSAREINSFLDRKDNTPKLTKVLDVLARNTIFSLQQEEKSNNSSTVVSNNLVNFYNSLVAGASGFTRNIATVNNNNSDKFNLNSISSRSKDMNKIKVLGMERSVYDMYKSQIKNTAEEVFKIFN